MHPFPRLTMRCALPGLLALLALAGAALADGGDRAARLLLATQQ